MLNKYVSFSIISGFLFIPVLSLAQTTIISSYSETNQNSVFGSVDANQNCRVSQSFTPSATYTLDSVKFYVKKEDTETGNTYAEIYAHTGTYGTSSVPTGTVLATSDAVSIASTFTTNLTLVTYNFSGANRITLTSGTQYVVVYYNSGTDTTTFVGLDDTSPTHGGNLAGKQSTCTSWTAYSGSDMIHYIYAEDVAGGGDPITYSSSSYNEIILASTLIKDSMWLFIIGTFGSIWYFRKRGKSIRT